LQSEVVIRLRLIADRQIGRSYDRTSSLLGAVILEFDTTMLIARYRS
jgi:hypothetical protein